MANLSEGTWPCLVQGATYGEDDKRNMVVRINVKITEGPDAGRAVTYEDTVNAKSALYIGRSCKAVGWKGDDLETLREDVDAWVKETGGASSAEIRHIEIKKGKQFDKWVDGGQRGPAPIWAKCNSIGRGPRPLAAPSAETLADAKDAMRRAMAEDGGGATDDGPSDDIPFISCSMTIGLGEIASVLK
jgi:hypothetical protein